ncbi:phage tail assembly chaperone [Epibacterium sp. SM1969]|uniref:Phage tail assembly chaperone n=1 Tax=Tritonibacter aquimaris TaxID=2663379 RepID=A0A844AN90_9RHOB|nr:rcc01693 family protein [Tritonibacter aquimaris]MQY41653.1 phage tail assembly chaperone [Tritonibacter aquimaris]
MSFNWPALLHLGLAQLRLTPDQFWALTPAELQLMLGPPPAAPMDRARLMELMTAFPDPKT